MSLRPLSGGRVKLCVQPTIPVAQSCYAVAHANLLLSTSQAARHTWLSLMQLLMPDLAADEAALVAFLTRLPGTVIAPAPR
jgi:hypothetical protein